MDMKKDILEIIEQWLNNESWITDLKLQVRLRRPLSDMTAQSNHIAIRLDGRIFPYKSGIDTILNIYHNRSLVSVSYTPHHRKQIAEKCDLHSPGFFDWLKRHIIEGVIRYTEPMEEILNKARNVQCH